MPEPIIVYVVKQDEIPGGGVQFIGLETWNERSAPTIVKRKIIGGKYKKKESFTVEDAELICEHIEKIKEARDEFMAPVGAGTAERLELIKRSQ